MAVAGATCGLSGGIEALGQRANAASGFGRNRRAVPKRGLRNLPKVIQDEHTEVMDTMISSTPRPYLSGMTLPRISSPGISPKPEKDNMEFSTHGFDHIVLFHTPSDATSGCINVSETLPFSFFLQVHNVLCKKREQ